MFFMPGDRERLDRVRTSQASLAHPDERFLLDAPTPLWTPHRSKTPAGNVNDVFSGSTTHQGRKEALFFKPIAGVGVSEASRYEQFSPVDVGLHEIVVWRLAREFGPPWSDMVPPAVWYAPPSAKRIQDEGPLLLGVGEDAGMPVPGHGFDSFVSDAAFFDALIGHQDRHDLNLRSTAGPPPRLFLIDHGYAFPCKHHPTNQQWPCAGIFGRMRVLGQRSWYLGPHDGTLDLSAVGSLDKALKAYEIVSLRRLQGDRAGLLGIATLLPDQRAEALRVRVDRMLAAQEVLAPGDF